MATFPALSHTLHKPPSIHVHHHCHRNPRRLLPSSCALPLHFPSSNVAPFGHCSSRRGAEATRMGSVWKIRSVAEETKTMTESSEQETTSSTSEQAFSVPVSPSDKLFLYFQAEGTIDEKVMPAMTKALEETEGISYLQSGVSEGIASVMLTKETTIQATGVASGLVEKIQGLGFKLQTLMLSFDEE
ncbi:hypothetical protein Droror1_Dr00024032 [Drosera rotundifolia]